VYHRLFKDSKIKQVKDTEFFEFLKLKQKGENSDFFISKFSNKKHYKTEDKRFDPKITLRSYKSK
jgi:hypothetical protein